MSTQSLNQMNLATFVEVLKRSELVDSERLRRTLKAIVLSSEDRKPTPNEVATKLVNAGMLTQWQAGKLLKGQYRGFCLGKYVMRRPLGRGGMGVVYEAEHSVLNTRVAVKLLPRAKNDVERSVSRFMAEARAAAKLNHPNLTRVHDCDVIDGRRFMVMELIQGRDLGELVARNGRLSMQLALSLTKQAAQGLEFAHENGVIHRDVKPQNFLVTPEGELKVTDLGLALFQVDSPERHTRDGENSVVGTVDFVAPEQAWESTNVDRRADIYSLGCTLYFMLVGKPPYASGTLAQRIAKHQTAQIPLVSESRQDCPPAVDKLCRLMMEKKPQDRIQHMANVVDACDQILQRLPKQARMTDELSGLDVGSRVQSAAQRARWNSTELLGLHGSDEYDQQAAVSTGGGFGLSFPDLSGNLEPIHNEFKAERSSPALSISETSNRGGSAGYWQPSEKKPTKKTESMVERSITVKLLKNPQFLLAIGLIISVVSIGIAVNMYFTATSVKPVNLIKTRE